MSRFWLTYCDPKERLRVLIMDSPGLVDARFCGLIGGLEQGAKFHEGHVLDETSAALVPPDAIGRMLKPEEVRNLIRERRRLPSAANRLRTPSLPLAWHKQTERLRKK